MISVQELKEQAIALGLAGGDVGKYVIEQQAIEREEREKERRAKKEEIEHKTRLAEIEAEKAKIEAEKAKIEAEKEKAKIEAEKEKAKIEAEKEKAKIEAEKELELARITATKQPTATPHDSVSRPQLPLLQEGEDIASYLNRFERIAELLKLSSDSYAVRLGTLLTGKAADMYISLSPEITKNYELLKKALLSGFNKTPDGYRVDFRNAKISPGETFLQFSFQLTRLFQAWLDSSEVGNTFNDLKDFMILDQFLSSLHPDLRAFIKERRPSTLTEAIRLADDWTSAHPNLPRTSIPNAKKFSRPPKPPKVTTVTPNPSSGRKDPPPLTCHGCGEIGHIRPRCPRNPRTFKEGTSTTQPYKASDYTGPLSDLLRKTSPEPLPWTEDLLDRFCHLKAAISSQPILRLPDPKLTFVLRTDASLYGLGAVLLQYHDECPHPVAYASRKLLDREKRYSTIERECLAVVFSISRFDYYLRGKEFVLEVDHKPLLYLATFKGKNDRLLRWALALQAYKFRVVHIAGKDNLGADLLSRS
ncbi:uncharacterized protein LOC143025500 isoform X2 [Oratosquilla oratoria]|uniref:uncharacterized protein LOC143025500 isoform X2 n=1 Tax=Oratosquilla oratoria TaxID=337810 RepID=UPI003F75B888